MRKKMTTHVPYYKAQSFICPHCNAFAGQRFETLFLVDNAHRNGNYPIELTTSFPYENSWLLSSDEQAPKDIDYWHVSICHSCKKSSFWEGHTLVYPLPTKAGFPEPSEDMPEKVAELYKEASAVFHISKRASAALMRAAAEQLVFELTKEDLPKANLNGRINYLSRSVPKHIFKALTIIRTIGNKVLHASDEITPAVTIYLDENVEGIPRVLASTLNALVNEFITNRDLVDGMFDDLPNSIRDGVADVMNQYESSGNQNDIGAGE